MNKKAMFKISYGLYVVTANKDGKDNGCITNTLGMLTDNPLQVSLTVNKANYTHDLIHETRKFTASVISEKAGFELFRHFGFQSGRNVDKFADFTACRRAYNDTLIITEGTNAYISAYVTQEIDLGSHTMFIATVTEAETLDDAKSATYTYYQENIKPKPQPAGQTKEGKTIWRCTICGYEYEGEELPEDFVCPICKHPASDFEKVVI